jgi:hypothetical protein
MSNVQKLTNTGVTWADILAHGKSAGMPRVVSLLKPYFCPDTGGHFKRGMRFNVSDHGSLWLKNSSSIKWQYAPAIKVQASHPVPLAYFLLETPDA